MVAPMKLAYEIGDPVWIAGYGDELTEGRVVHKFTLKGWCVAEHYVVEIPTEIDPLLEVRDPMTMSHTAEGPMGLWRLVAHDRPAPMVRR